MARNSIKTGKRIASKASKALKGSRSSANKSIAGSALSNTQKDTARKKK